ncbi:lim domain containing protein [Grosmannia clavigera kw1407]|uniref:Lim domain containing protein n=1 Tax=Grosmannia clavigera (strain kw1407 / UAMH 11150) TaxID=655863 RepID=F0X9B6_GROCL|nr:lim domain containing protein [Grosmannia clavigera kw1407]EFX05944.1 lim domain containing protein [Grosmannia clavigera kw1407]
MSIRAKPRERSSRKMTPPSASYMSDDQFFCATAALSGRAELDRFRPSCVASRRLADRQAASGTLPRTSSDLSDVSVVGSLTSRYSTISGRGRDYYPEKKTSSLRTLPPPLRPDEVVPTDTYIERGQRWMEKEEAVSLRHALEDMDLKGNSSSSSSSSNSSNSNTATGTTRPLSTVTTKALVPAPAADGTTPEDADEHRIYHAALDEAAELVWQHQNGVKPPEPGTPYSYKQHLRKNSYAYARTASVGRYGDDIEPTGLARDPAARSVSDSSASSVEGNGFTSSHSRYSLSSSTRPSLDQPAAVPEATTTATATATATIRSSAYTSLTGGPRPMAKSSSAAKRRSSMKRNISGEVEKPFSGDQIYEEPETATEKDGDGSGDKTAESSGSSSKSSNSILRAAVENTVHGSSNTLAAVSKLVSRYEIHRNPPSQSRNPQYTTNAVSKPVVTVQPQAKQQPPSEPGRAKASRQRLQASVVSDDEDSTDSAAGVVDGVPRLNGVEIRSDEIRQATSMKLKDRNPKLPTPSFVSDNPGRPIVSFDANWKQEAPPVVAGQESATDAQLEGSGSGSRARFGSSSNNSSSTATPEPRPKGSPSPFSSAVRGRFSTAPSVPVVAPVASSWSTPPSRQQQSPTRREGAMSDSSKPIHSRNDSNPLPTIAVTPSEPPRPSHRMSMSIPSISVSAEPSSSSRPPIPTIVLPGDDADESKVSDDNSTARQQGRSRPLPSILTPDQTRTSATPTTASRRPLPTPGSSSWPRGHWSRAPPSGSSASNTSHASASRATALCHECGYAIEGRFVALAGQRQTGSTGSTSASATGSTAAAAGLERFHPGCFRCHACGTSLEALEISPEPDKSRAARLDRIARRAHGEQLEERPGETMAEDGDGRLRFFCHLDWHELYAPRCHHCTTPIVGEHVVALGHHWHVGHFFCAECGDPFGPGATHIEKDGYAWCVGCQTRRTERRAPRCRACGKPAIGAYVQALGAEWHDDCFRCAVCEGGFVDGQIFPRQGKGGLMQVVCTGYKGRIGIGQTDGQA